VNGGRPGEIETVSYLFPFASYPVTNEVLLTWASGIARSLVPLLLWTQIALLATALATFAGVRALGASRRASGLAAAALVSTPVLVQQLGTPSTDAAALLWLACAGALGASARERPGLLAPALVAAGLAAGTKTTALPLALVVIALGGWCLRAQLRAHARSLAAAALLALAVGAVWLARNTVTHGWPLWPFESRLGADPVPPVWAQIDASLLERPGATLSGRVGGYLDQFGGAVLLVAAGVLAWLAARRRAVAVASAITAGAALLWALAPSTGKPDSPVFDVNLLSTTRYALPAVAAGAVALALASRAAAAAVLGAAVVWNVVLDVQLGHLTLPYAWAFAAAAALGVFVARFAGRRPALPRAALPAAAVAAAAALALPADGLVARHAAVAPTIPGASVAAWAARQPGFESGATIRFAGTVIGQLAGDRLQHRLVLLAPDAPCDEVRAAADDGLLVVAEPGVFARLHVRTPAGCAAGLTPSFEAPGVRVYGALR
jgi:hypothetical protein